MEEMTQPPTLDDDLYGTPTLDDLIANFGDLLTAAEGAAEEAEEAVDSAESEAESVSGTSDKPSDYAMQQAVDTLCEMQAALEKAGDPDLSAVTDAIEEAREKTGELRSTVTAMREAFERLVSAVRSGATVAPPVPAEPSPLDLARAEHARLAEEAREAEADFDRAYRRRNDALHASANAFVVVRRLEEAAAR